MKTHERITAVSISQVKTRVSVAKARTFGTSDPQNFLSTTVVLDVEGKQVRVPDSLSTRTRKKRVLAAMGLNGSNVRSGAARAELEALWDRVQKSIDKSVSEHSFDLDKLTRQVGNAREKARKEAEIRRHEECVDAIKRSFSVYGHILTTEEVHRLWDEFVTERIMVS